MCEYGWDPDIHRFISGQTELQTLGWYLWDHEQRPFPGPLFKRGDLRQLRNIDDESDRKVLELVPRRPICRVRHGRHDPPSSDTLRLLSQSSKKVEVYVTPWLPTTRDVLEDFKCYLPHLRFLGCYTDAKNVSRLSHLPIQHFMKRTLTLVSHLGTCPHHPPSFPPRTHQANSLRGVSLFPQFTTTFDQISA